MACLSKTCKSQNLMESQEYINKFNTLLFSALLTQWGRVTYICVCKLIIIGSDNGLSPGRRQAIIWTNYWILFIRSKLQRNLKRNSYIFIQENAPDYVISETAAILSRPQCVQPHTRQFLPDITTDPKPTWSSSHSAHIINKNPQIIFIL